MLTAIITLTVFWVLGIIFYELVLSRFLIDRLRKFYWTALYFLVLSALVAWGFMVEIQALKMEISPRSLFPLAGFIVLDFMFQRELKKRFAVPKQFLRENPNLHFAFLDSRHLISNFFISLFQQLAYAALLGGLLQRGLSVFLSLGLMAAASLAFHSLLIFKIGKYWGLYFTFFGAVSIYVFGFMLLNVPSGLIYNLIFHTWFYTLTAAGIWLYWQHKQRGSAEHLKV